MTLTQESLDAFYSPDEVLYRQPLYSPIRYSPGVHYVAEAGEAWWLLNIIASEAWLGTAVKDAWMQVWTLTVPPSKRHSTLTCTDGDGQHLMSQDIDLTNFPLPTITIWVVDQIMMLPQEY